MSPKYVIEPLEKTHDRKSFTCGIESLDQYLKQQASQDMRRQLAAAYVMRLPESSTIIGYFTLSAYAIEHSQLPEDLQKRIRYEHVPAALLGRLAVDQHYQGQGFGGLLLSDALSRAISTELAVMAVVVDAIDDRARRFYESYGFERLADHENRLYITANTIKELVKE